MKKPIGLFPPFETPLSGYAYAGSTFVNDPDRRTLLRGVVVMGKRNFGTTFATTGDVIADECDRLSRLCFSAINALISRIGRAAKSQTPRSVTGAIPMPDFYSILPDIISNTVSEIAAGLILSLIFYIFRIFRNERR